MSDREPLAADDPAPRPGSRLAPLSITQLNEAADETLRDALGPLWVQGELSRFLAHRSGHWYFSLTDGAASVACAMFRGRNLQVAFEPQDGLAVLALANAGVYPPQGRFQLVIEALEPLGHGAAALAFEQLKRRLAAEGLFAAARKRPLPPFPRTIGVVTSLDGAAVRDVLEVLRRRFGGLSILIAPALVQGRGAAASIGQALQALDRRGLDVLLLVRGGGAREDLAAFDDESVVRAIAACSTPVVTGIGHEVDVTLADLAADLRAATPSQAAELVVRERVELQRHLEQLQGRLRRAISLCVERARAALQRAERSRGLLMFGQRLSRVRLRLVQALRRLEEAQTRQVDELAQRVEALRQRLDPSRHRLRLRQRRATLQLLVARFPRAVERDLGRRRRQLATATAALHSLSPLAVLGRGYALVTWPGPAGAIVDDAGQLRPGETIHIRLARGAADAVVEVIHPAREGAEQ